MFGRLLNSGLLRRWSDRSERLRWLRSAQELRWVLASRGQALFLEYAVDAFWGRVGCGHQGYGNGLWMRVRGAGAEPLGSSGTAAGAGG